MARKTISVAELKQLANDALASSTFPHIGIDTRMGTCQFLESILHRTGNYGGFSYLGKDHVPTGEIPGISWAADRKSHKIMDPSRRVYH